MTRKERSEAYLQEHGVKINPNLPDIESNTQIKSGEAILRRAVAAMLASQIAVDLGEGNNVQESAAFFTKLIYRFDLVDELTDVERMLFALANPQYHAELSPEDGRQLSWRIEMCMPLFWACGLLKGDMPYPDHPSDIQGLVRMIGAAENFDALLTLVKVRTNEEILDQADLIFRMDWACAEARLNRTDITGGLDYDVVVEQHKGLNWIIGAFDAENWDTVRPHT